MNGPALVVDGGAAAAAPGGALHFGMALRARYAAPARRRPAAVAGLPFAALGRRYAPPPVPVARPAGPGLPWRVLGAAPLREEPAPAAGLWCGALGEAPRLDGDDADSSLPERLPAEPVPVVRDAGAPFRPLPQAPAREVRGASTEREAAEEPRGADRGPGMDGGADAPRPVPVFPGLPERLVPAWALGGGDPPIPAGSHLPRDPSPVPLPLQLPMGAPGEAAAPDRIDDGSPGQPSGRGEADPRMGEAPSLTWASPAAPGDASGPDAGDGGSAATPGARALADAGGSSPLAWAMPTVGGGGEPDASLEVPRLAWAEPGGGTSAGAVVAERTEGVGEPGPYAPTLLHGITLAAQSLATAAERRESVRETWREAQEAARPAPVPPPQPAMDPTSDEVTRILMRKMAAMAREERFRAGGLR